MIRFRDFVPDETEAAAFLKPARFEDAETIIGEINTFVSQYKVEVINIETVLMPNLRGSDSGSTDMQLHTSGEMGAYWYQVFRLWYRYPE